MLFFLKTAARSIGYLFKNADKVLAEWKFTDAALARQCRFLRLNAALKFKTVKCHLHFLRQLIQLF